MGGIEDRIIKRTRNKSNIFLPIGGVDFRPAAYFVAGWTNQQSGIVHPSLGLPNHVGDDIAARFCGQPFELIHEIGIICVGKFILRPDDEIRLLRGERETRWQIFLYTIEHVVLTLVLPLFGLGGGVYFVAAVLLGGLLLYSAYKVWQGEGNKVAWKMYRHSSMYLAFLFLALMVDALL
jgi:hypothetical protein